MCCSNGPPDTALGTHGGGGTRTVLPLASLKERRRAAEPVTLVLVIIVITAITTICTWCCCRKVEITARAKQSKHEDENSARGSYQSTIRRSYA